MKREELVEIINDDRSSDLTKVVAESAIKELRIKELEEIEHKYNQLCWQHEALQDEDEKLEKRIKALEDELQVANRCADDARKRIKELEAVIKENLITEQTDKSED